MLMCLVEGGQIHVPTSEQEGKNRVLELIHEHSHTIFDMESPPDGISIPYCSFLESSVPYIPEKLSRILHWLP